MAKDLDLLFGDLRKSIIELVDAKFSDRKTFPKSAGVYVIYRGRKPFYVGKAQNLYRRINNHHVSGSRDGHSSTFRTTVHQKLRIDYGQDMKSWIERNCRFTYSVIPESDQRSLVESFLIALLKKRGIGLLNKDHG